MLACGSCQWTTVQKNWMKCCYCQSCILVVQIKLLIGTQDRNMCKSLLCLFK